MRLRKLSAEEQEEAKRWYPEVGISTGVTLRSLLVTVANFY